MYEDDNRIDYSYAGPGARRREQAERTARKRDQETRPIRERMPERKSARQSQTKAERIAAADISGIKLKRMIRLRALTMDAREIENEMKDRGISVSLIAIGNIRSH